MSARNPCVTTPHKCAAPGLCRYHQDYRVAYPIIDDEATLAELRTEARQTWTDMALGRGYVPVDTPRITYAPHRREIVATGPVFIPGGITTTDKTRLAGTAA